jgi:hypothetical protein
MTGHDKVQRITPVSIVEHIVIAVEASSPGSGGDHAPLSVAQDIEEVGVHAPSVADGDSRW